MTGVQTCALPICFPVTISAQKKYHDNKFVVIAVPEGYDEVAVGDTILTEKDCDRPIESNELFGELDYDLFKVETKDILAILP